MFQCIIALVSTILNLYFVLCFLIDAELRELQNYPIFLTTLIDFIACGFGFLGDMFSKEFLRHHFSSYGSKLENTLSAETSLFNYMQLRRYIREIFAPILANHIRDLHLFLHGYQISYAYLIFVNQMKHSDRLDKKTY